MPSLYIANLDAEEQWASGERAARTLPRRVYRRIAAFGTLFRVLTRRDDALWLPAAIDPERLPALGPGPPPRLVTGSPAETLRRFPAHRLHPWAKAPPWAACESARRVNDRRFALALGRRLGVADPRITLVRSLEDLREHAATHAVERWVVKAPFSASGRERHVHRDASERGGGGSRSEAALHALLGRHGELVFEPWHERILDVGVLFQVPLDAEPRAHRQILGPTGAVRALELDVPIPESLRRLARRVAVELARVGYRGPAGVDAWLHVEDGAERWHLLGEINARWSIGHLARAAVESLPGWTDIDRPRLEAGGESELEHARREHHVAPLLLPSGGEDGLWLVGRS